ncbi:hypothetical protein [Rhodoferax sp.]|uniref:hypothetical protein n=1 Tax=Rhodoferax sp. TaxID=50421 RepID=UPI00345B7D10
MGNAALHIGAVAFINRFDSSLNGRIHFQVCVVDGVFAEVAGKHWTSRNLPFMVVMYRCTAELNPSLKQSLSLLVKFVREVRQTVGIRRQSRPSPIVKISPSNFLTTLTRPWREWLWLLLQAKGGAIFITNQAAALVDIA